MIIRDNFLSLHKSFIIAFCLIAFNLLAMGQETKVAIQAPENVVVGEQFKVSYILESDKDVKEQPVIIKNMPGFEIIYGPSVSTSVSSTTNKGKVTRTYSVTSTYILKAGQKGIYTLPQAETIINGKKYKPDSFKITVKSKDDTKKAAIGDIDAFIKVSVSKTSMNLSDTITITYRLYTTKDIQNIEDADFPATDDFYTSNITRRRQNFSEKIINDRTYKVIELRKLLLQPRRLGEINIPEGSVTVQYSVPTGRKMRDIWGDIYDEVNTSTRVLKIDSIVIRVHDLKAI
jgi:hypothetical protein